MPHPQPFAEHRFQHFVERPGHTGQTVVAGQQHRFGRSGQQKGSLPFHDTFGERHHRDFIVGGDYLTAAAEGRTEDNEGYKSLHIGLVLNKAKNGQIKTPARYSHAEAPSSPTCSTDEQQIWSRSTVLAYGNCFNCSYIASRKNPKAWAMLPPKTIASGS